MRKYRTAWEEEQFWSNRAGEIGLCAFVSLICMLFLGVMFAPVYENEPQSYKQAFRN